MCTILNVLVLPDQRRGVILQRLASEQRVIARDLAVEFGVSEDAIRRDLRDLAEAGKCRRVYGGALPVAGPAPFVERVDRDFSVKRPLARAAAALIAPDATVYIDAGSTNLLLAESLMRGRPVTVVTNSVAVAAAVYRRPEVRLFLIGGLVDPDVDGALGGGAMEQIGRYRPDLTVLGACAVDPDIGLTAHDDRDADLKRAAVAGAGRVVLLATNDKLGRSAPHHVAAAPAIQTLIVEHDAPEEICAAFADQGIEIIRAARETDAMPLRADRD